MTPEFTAEIDLEQSQMRSITMRQRDLQVNVVQPRKTVAPRLRDVADADQANIRVAASQYEVKSIGIGRNHTFR